MSYLEHALKALKANRSSDIPDLMGKYASGKAKILASENIFRLMSFEESKKWSAACPLGASNISPAAIKSLFEGGGGYTSKWFTFERPYVFTRQEINVPGGREGQGFLMTISLNHEMKNTLTKKLLPDVKMTDFPDELKKESCRCKVEGGTVTLGIPMALLEQMAINMTIDQLGARITPFTPQLAA